MIAERASLQAAIPLVDCCTDVPRTKLNLHHDALCSFSQLQPSLSHTRTHTHTHTSSYLSSLSCILCTSSIGQNHWRGKTVSETIDMEEQICRNDLQFSPLAINWIANNISGLLGDRDANQHYIITTPGCHGILPQPVPAPQWMRCQQPPRHYVEFLAEKGYPEIQKQLSCGVSAQVCNSGLADPSQLEHYLRQHSEGNLITALTGLEYQSGVQKQDLSEQCSQGFQAPSRLGAAKLKYPSDARRKRSREKAYATDRLRRLKISHWLDALQELMPHSKVVGKEALMDDVIDHVKYLQYQVQDLCRSRLGGESTSNSFIFVEGHGHYLVQKQMLNGPLEEMTGKLIDVYPSAATELLQSRGLIVMPMTLAEGLLEPMEMLGMQD